MKSLIEIQTEVQNIIREYPEEYQRFKALQDAGYTDLHYTYVKNIGIGRIQYLKRKNIYRLQVAPTELKKNYPAAWVVDISDSNVDSYAELPF
ncbi:MAG: hypothetical protein KA807_14785 [Prolixibacteraceae bacterium]|jgi:hypothetical protein|nr:hypothetical protein [Prolixibacteraceae bacterium]